MPEETDEIRYETDWRMPYTDIFVVTGPNARNTVKLLVARERKKRQNQYLVTTTYHEQYCRWSKRMVCEHIVRCTPNPQHLKSLEDEWAAYQEEHLEEELSNAWRRSPGLRPKKPNKRSRCALGHKPVLDEIESIEEILLKPRYRKQRGWGHLYRPTRKRRRVRDDLKNWKRHRLSRWKTPSVSFRSTFC